MLFKEKSGRSAGLARFKLAALALLIVVLYQFAVQSAFASTFWEKANNSDTGIGQVEQEYGGAGQDRDIRDIIAVYVTVFLGFLGLIFVVIILVAGFKWMTSQGESSKVEDARKQLQHGIIGLLIVLAAWGIAFFVIKAIHYATTGEEWI